MHIWITLAAADTMSWSAIALVSGESVGPSVRIDQCERCGVLRLQPAGFKEPRVYGDKGELRLVEPDCRPG